MMKQVNHKGPISHKVVSEEEFARMAREKAEETGEHMVEKTIFIVKPIYVPVPVMPGPKTEVTGKMAKKQKKKQQKTIYMERMHPPNYRDPSEVREGLSKKTSKISKSTTKKSKTLDKEKSSNGNRSPSPFKISDGRKSG